MALTLHMHPLASFCHKVLIALYENDTAFNSTIVDYGDAGSAAALFAKWPLGKIPLLDDSALGQTVPETSIIIEYLQDHYPGPVPLLPADRDALLQVRLWDRFYDLYVSVPMQKIVADRLRPMDAKDPFGTAEAHATLVIAYQMIDAQMKDKVWAIGADFTMADCAALPALFFASILHPFADGQIHLAAYFERLLRRPSIRRVLNEAQPYLPMFPFQDLMPARFLQPQ